MAGNLLEKVWELHKVATLPSGQDQMFVDLHLIHEVTSPQAFQMMRERGLSVLYPERTIATVDHIVPTDTRTRPLADPRAEEMLTAIEDNTRGNGIRFFGLGSPEQGIVHIIGPELGLTQPGSIIACGDSHTSTHGAFGALAFGIGTSQIRDVLATQTLALSKPKVRRISVDGKLPRWVYAKDIILGVIAKLGVKGGIGYAYEYGGSAIESLGMEARLTVCNMSIEGGARAGYVNPDAVTYRYMEGRKFAPKGAELERAMRFWKSIASEPGASYDDEFRLNADSLAPMVAWGINPGQAVSVTERLPLLADVSGEDREVVRKAYEHTGFSEGAPVQGLKIDVAFLGSCTNGRLSDLREAVAVVRGRKVAGHVKALAVPGSAAVAAQAEAEGLDEIFRQAGFQWRTAGCSMCLAMNPDKLIGRQVSASSSNRNFIGRQGSATGRTLLMSPAMVAAAAVAGEVMDVRRLMGEAGEAKRA